MAGPGRSKRPQAGPRGDRLPGAEPAAAAEPLIERLGLSDIAAKLPEEISGGQAQRAGLARALAGQPRLILADEPTGQLDSTTAAGLMAVLLEQVSATQAALIVATHDTALAGRLPLRWQLIDRRMQTGAELSCSS